MALAPVLLASEAVGTAATWTANIPAGKYEYFALVLTGTNTATAITEADIGRVRISESSRDLVNADAIWLRRMQCLRGGNARQVFTVSGAAEYTLCIPRGYGDDNIHRVIEADAAQVQITFGANWPARIATALWKLYGLVRQTGEMRYNLRIMQQNIQMSAAGTYSTPLKEENVVAIYVERDGTVANIDNVRLMQDQELACNVVRFEDLNDISDAIRETDSLATANTEGIANASSNLAAIELANFGEVGEFLSDELVLEITTAAAATGNDLATLIVSADFSPSKLKQTRLESAAVFQRKMARKNSLNRTRPLQALRVASE